MSERKKIVELQLGPLAEKWPKEDAQKAILNRLSQKVNATEDLYFFRDVMLEILRQNPGLLANTDFRGFGDLLQKKRAEIQKKTHQEYIQWAHVDWSRRCEDYKKTGKFVVSISGFGDVSPAIFDEEGKLLPDDEWVHRPVEAQPGVIATLPKAEDDIESEWKQELIQGGFDGNGVHVLSLKKFTWHFNVYHVLSGDRELRTLRGFLENKINTLVTMHGWIGPEVAFKKNEFATKGVLGKFLFVGYRVKLVPEYRRALQKKFAVEEEKTGEPKKKSIP